MTVFRREIGPEGEPLCGTPSGTGPITREMRGAARLYPHNRTLAACACACAEFVLLAAVGVLLAATIEHGGRLPEMSASLILSAALASSAAAMATMIASGSYWMRALASPHSHRPALLAASIGMLANLSVLAPKIGSHAWTVALLWGVVAILLLMALRSVWASLVQGRFRSGALLYRIAVLGDGPAADRIRTELRKRVDAGIALSCPDDLQVALTGWDSAEHFCRACRIDAIVIEREDAGHTLEQMRAVPASVWSMPGVQDADRDPGTRNPLRTLGLVQVQPRVFSEAALVAKSAFDLVVSSLVLLMILPTMVMVALAIRLDSRGPILFRQPRIGYGNQTFAVLKFRTMYHDKADMLAARQTERGDPRITRVGRVLRRLSLDELPQLINVLRGEMSLVGPRPHAPNTSVEGRLLAEAVDDYALRHRVRPGMTGWAQVNGARGALRTQEQLERRLRLDLDYIARWSLWLDLRILMVTTWREIFSSSAY